jgi:multiple sugar transport system ATP-binding protein
MADVTFTDVTKMFGDFTAVDKANLHIEDGEFMVLVGPSGCGKTTLLRMAAGLEEITSGELQIGDRKVNDDSPKDRDIAMVFQNYALYPHMDVYKNMAFGLKLRKIPKPEIDRRVKEAADLLGLNERLHHKPRQLSGGQRQRVAVGRAIVRDPQVFLFDEPLSNLDAKLRVQMRAELQRLHRRLKTTTIYVTHDQVEAMTLGSRVAVMKDAVMQQIDTPQNLYDFPTNRFVAGFIGSPAMNFSDVIVVEEDGKVKMVGESFKLIVPPEKEAAIRPFMGEHITFGIRPENLSLDKDGTAESYFEVLVGVLEPLGDELVIYGESDGHELVAQLEPRAQVEAEQIIRLSVDMEHMHAFDPVTEESLFIDKD